MRPAGGAERRLDSSRRVSVRLRLEHARQRVGDLVRSGASVLEPNSGAGVDDLLRDDRLIVADRRDDERETTMALAWLSPDEWRELLERTKEEQKLRLKWIELEAKTGRPTVDQKGDRPHPHETN